MVTFRLFPVPTYFWTGLDSCTVQAMAMVDGSASEALQTHVLYMEMYMTMYCTQGCPWLMGDVLCTVHDVILVYKVASLR